MFDVNTTGFNFFGAVNFDIVTTVYQPDFVIYWDRAI